MRKEKIAGVITIVMTAAFFLALLWGYGQYQQSKRAMTMLENEYQRAYYNYMADLEEMTLVAGKVQSAANLQKILLLDRLSALAGAAADHMSQLPVQQGRYQRSIAYFNQMGDYAASLGQKLVRAETLAEQDEQNLSAVYGQLQDVYAKMTEMEQAVANEGIVFAAAESSSWWQAIRSAVGGNRAAQGVAAAAVENSADGFFSRANALLDTVEPLSYKGKYSAHLASLPAYGLDGQKPVTEAEVLQRAGDFLAQLGWPQTVLNSVEQITVSETLPVFLLRFSDGPAENATEESFYLTVSQSGGQVISFIHQRPVGQAGISAKQALNKAEELLNAAGYTQMQLISRQTLGNELLLQYAPQQAGVLCYQDGVDIKVALDNGGITAFNAYQYWMHHQQRVLPENVAAEGQVLAFISDGAGGETLCCEIKSTVGEEQYLSYIGVESQLEEQILRDYLAPDESFYRR